METEGDIQLAVLRFLRGRLPRIVRVQSGTFRARGAHVHAASPGTPDLMGFCNHGRIVAIEVKKPGGTITPEQRAFIDAVQRAGGIAGVARCVADAEMIVNTGCTMHRSQQ